MIVGISGGASYGASIRRGVAMAMKEINDTGCWAARVNTFKAVWVNPPRCLRLMTMMIAPRGMLAAAGALLRRRRCSQSKKFTSISAKYTC
jgi:hypothetical protein